MVNWIPVMYSLPDNGRAVLVVADDLTMRDLGKPSVYVDVAYYEKENDSFVFLLDATVSRGQVFFWADFPDPPHALMHNVFSCQGLNK